MTYKKILENQYYVLVRGKEGLFLANKNDRFIGRALIEYGEFSDIQWNRMKPFLNSGDVIIDVGANIGGHTISFANHVGANGEVWAFEPQPIIFQNLCANVALNALQNVKTFLAGCGAEAKNIEIPFIDYNQRHNFGSLGIDDYDDKNKLIKAAQNIPIMRLDDVFNADRLAMIKIDVEGMELQVLKGAENIIKEFKPVLYVENDREDLSAELLSYILDLGYEAWWDRPSLFNPDNFAGKTDNVLGNFMTTNNICIHKDAGIHFNTDAAKVNTVSDRPFKR